MTNKWLKMFILLVIAIFVIWVLSGLVLFYFTQPVDWPLNVQKLGALGDYFGVFSALFTALAFAGLVITILLQREDIIAQKGQFDEQRMEIKRQAFESTFFELLRRRDEIINSINSTSEGKGIQQTFNNLINSMETEYTTESIDVSVDKEGRVLDQYGYIVGHVIGEEIKNGKEDNFKESLINPTL